MAISSIKDWAEEDRPREKMLLKGCESLSNAELIAILLGSGSREETAVSLAKRVLYDAGSLDELGKKPMDFLTSFKGIGDAKAISVTAALELGRRRQVSSPEKKKKISSSQEAYQILGPLLKDLAQEEFWVVSLDRANQVVSKDRMSIGGVHGTVVDAKVIFAKALSNGASGLLLFHNHPSGQLKPSKEDRKITSKLIEAGKVLDIVVQDHLIIGSAGYFSFRDEGLM